MTKRIVAILVLGCLLISLSGCALIWGSDRGHKLANSIATNKEGCELGYFVDNRHMLTHMEVILKDMRKMHKFWDRYFMNYDWDDPYID